MTKLLKITGQAYANRVFPGFDINKVRVLRESNAMPIQLIAGSVTKPKQSNEFPLAVGDVNPYAQIVTVTEVDASRNDLTVLLDVEQAYGIQQARVVIVRVDTKKDRLVVIRTTTQKHFHLDVDRIAVNLLELRPCGKSVIDLDSNGATHVRQVYSGGTKW